LNTARENRPPTLSDSMSGFPYVNGGIFAEQLPIFNFNKSMRTALVASTQYDWSTISPAIFGSLFQSVRDAETRREMGEHYTSETNILRCINDLFLNDFYKRMREAWDSPQALKSLRMELGQYNYLDPACGSGNFLVVAYKRMRDIELRIIARLQELDNKSTQLQLDGSLGLQVHLGQFHGIEIDEWSASIARVAMFLADHQANLALEQITGTAPNRFPLAESAVIVNANALTTDWSEVCPMSSKTYVMGNPPFYGSALQSREQKQDVEAVWAGIRGAGNLDYVTNWYLIAARLIARHGGRAAFVSTNSITQGEQPAVLWGELSKLRMRIDFAHQTFRWSNDASGVAAVHVVIIGFSKNTQKGSRKLWVYPDIKAAPNLREVENINGYLLDAPDLLITTRSKPLNSSTPLMDYGSKPTDGGHLSDISGEEAAAIRSSDVIAAKYLRRIIGARELIHNSERYCLWLQGADPSDIKKSKVLSERVAAVRTMRSESTKLKTQQDAARAQEFQEIRQPETDYLAVPLHSSEDRQYVPMVWFDSSVITNNAVSVIGLADVGLFGFLQSRPFNVWNKAVSGRLESRVRISNTITYNNFPFPEMGDVLLGKVKASAQMVLDARAKFPTNSLADLYESASMPPELAKAHAKLDADVLAAYGLKVSASDAEILEVLFTMYAEQSKSAKS